MNFKANESVEKLRGGYYTPPAIARYLARWICGARAKTVLEPSCGDGQFVQALAHEHSGQLLDLTAIELLEEEASKAEDLARSLNGLRTKVVNDDFLSWCLRALHLRGRFDAVVGNPPFIRYQYLPALSQQRAEALFRAFNLPFTKHTNAWLPFVIGSLGMLRPGGRLAMVVPSELIHVMHAQVLRNFLRETCARVLVIDPEELWFEGTLQGAVLLLAEKKCDRAESFGLSIQRVSGQKFLFEDPEAHFESARFRNGKMVEGKWTHALMSPPTRSLYESVSENTGVELFADIADVDVGLVTGANKFFLVPDAVVDHYGLRQWSHPMFGRSEHCPGVIYDKKQHRANALRGLPTNFLWFKELDEEQLPAPVSRYLEEGMNQGLHERFKCRVRRPWFEVPSVYATDVGMLKRCHDAPRLIQNVCGAYTTDTAYRVRTKAAGGAAKLVYCFLNSLTALSAELEGRHYGGGVLELVPSEIERLLIPTPPRVRVAVSSLDRKVRSLPMHEVLALQDRSILEAIGLAKADQDRIHDGWRALRDRRHRVASGKLDDLEAEDGWRPFSSIKTEERIQEVAASY